MAAVCQQSQQAPEIFGAMMTRLGAHPGVLISHQVLLLTALAERTPVFKPLRSVWSVSFDLLGRDRRLFLFCFQLG